MKMNMTQSLVEMIIYTHIHGNEKTYHFTDFVLFISHGILERSGCSGGGIQQCSSDSWGAVGRPTTDIYLSTYTESYQSCHNYYKYMKMDFILFFVPVTKQTSLTSQNFLTQEYELIYPKDN